MIVDFDQRLTCDDMRHVLHDFFLNSSHTETQKLWDVLTALRGPDAPSEGSGVVGDTYDNRRKRKYETTEIIRERAFFGAMGGAARYHKGYSIVLHKATSGDHFSRHAAEAAIILGLKIIIKGTK